MEIEQCKLIVQTVFKQQGSFTKHIDNKQLVVMDQGFCIQPDDSYVFTDHVIVVEYEDTKRPVESISKYWWLFENTSWKSLQVKMTCCVFLIRQDLNDIRNESVAILGKELATKYPNLFTFHCLAQTEMTDSKLRTFMETICRNQ